MDYTFSELDKNDRIKSVMFSKDFNFGDSSFSSQLLLNLRKFDYKLILPEFYRTEYVQPKKLIELASRVSSEVVVSHGVLKKDDFVSFDPTISLPVQSSEPREKVKAAQAHKALR